LTLLLVVDHGGSAVQKNESFNEVFAVGVPAPAFGLEIFLSR
jgi:hypothetical protein